MTWSFPRRDAPPDLFVPTVSVDASVDDTEGKGDGSAGGVQLRPDEALLDPALAREQAQHEEERGEGSSGEAAVDGIERFGLWEFDSQSIMLFHRQRNRQLMLAQLDSSLKIMKVLVALGTQTDGAGGWDVDGLLRALDRAARVKFSKSLYQLASSLQDTATLDWRAGQICADKAPLIPEDKSSFAKEIAARAAKTAQTKNARLKSTKQQGS